MPHLTPALRRATFLLVLTFATPAVAQHEIAFEFETLRGYCCGTHQALAAAGRLFVLGVATDLGAHVSVRDGRTGREVRRIDAVAPTDDTQLFGWAVASSPRGLLIGAPAVLPSGGATFLLGRRGVRPSMILQSPEASGRGDYFGTTVLWTGHGVLVGDAQKNRGGAATGPGMAYVFEARTGALRTTFHPPEPHDGAAFGAVAAAFQGGFAIGEPGTATVAGAVHLYDRGGRYCQTLAAPLPTPGDYFGSALAGSGRHLLIGAPGSPGGGAAYLVRREHGHGRLVRTFAGEPYGAMFGASVALDRRRVALGSPATYGGVYLFDRDAGTPPEHVAPPPFDPDSGYGYHPGLGAAIALVRRALVVASTTADESDTGYVVGYRPRTRFAPAPHRRMP